MRSLANDMAAKGCSKKWLENAERQGVSPEVVDEIARRHSITTESFQILEKMEEIKDPDGKSFFLIPPGTSGDEARKATLMTYIVNAGTGYGKPGKQPADFSEPPYSAAEVARIGNRQKANRWSYSRDVRFRRPQWRTPRHDPERYPHGSWWQLDPEAVQPAGRHHLG